MFAYGDDEDEPWKKWSIYDCLVFETSHDGRRFVLTAGEWFEIDRNFAEQVGRILGRIPKPKLSLPSVLVKGDGSLETSLTTINGLLMKTVRWRCLTDSPPDVEVQRVG